MLDRSLLTLVQDGETAWAAATDTLARALARHFIIEAAPQVGIVFAVECNFNDEINNSYAALCRDVEGDENINDTDINAAYGGRMTYEPAVFSDGFVLRGAIAAATWAAFNRE